MALFGRKNALPMAAEPVARQARTLPGAPATDEAGRRSLEDHRAFLLSQVKPLRPFGMGVLEAYGQTLCETIDADLDLPTYTSAAVAGFAVRGSDLVGAGPARPVKLPVVDTLDGPGYRGSPLTAGTVVRVSAGAPIPEGADAVVPFAAVDDQGEQATFTGEVTHHANLRLAGSDIAEGERLLEAGDVLGAGAIGLLAEVGIDKVLVRPRPRVVVMTVGDHLVAPGHALTTRAQRYDSTTTLIAASARADGAQIFTVPSQSPTAGRVKQVLTDQLIRADLLVVVGGTGPEGVVEDVLTEIGEVDFCEVAVHPGSRQGFAIVDGTPVVVIPGGTVAAFTSYYAFVRPLVHKLAGTPNGEAVGVPMPARSAFRGTMGVTELVPVRLTVRGADPVGTPGRELAFDLARADGLAVLPPDVDDVAAHADVECWVFDDTTR